MPDNAILFDLCKVLDINVNELLSGEKLSDDSYHGKAEENMMTLMKEKQNNGRVNAIVAVIGLLTDETALGPNLAVAILTLLYSLVLELLLLPVAAKLWAMKKEE